MQKSNYNNKILSNRNKKSLSNHNDTNLKLHSEVWSQNSKLKMTDEKIPVPKDEVNGNFLCSFPTWSWSGERIDQCQVVKKFFDNEGKIFFLRLKGQELVVTLTKEIIKFLHTKKDDAYGFTGFMDLENKMVNCCKVKSATIVKLKEIFYRQLVKRPHLIISHKV